jgi:hypothetical protein
MKKRAEDLCEGDVILTSDDSPLTVEEAIHSVTNNYIYIKVSGRSGGVFTFKAPPHAEFKVVTMQLWAALHTHEFGNDSYLFLVDATEDITLPIDETKVAKMLGLDFSITTEVVHSARLVNHSIANITDLRDHKGNPLPIYKD